ncbi:MAG: DUF368 domain-containing protein [Pseudomonadaceae bacterium]|nr:DUF368 domain-containing protein [Pseudomonadaceae bacterium]
MADDVQAGSGAMQPIHIPGLLARGFAMGVAELVPGVSGGTIALITGIYDRFISALAGLSPLLLKHLKDDGLINVWRRYDLGFLATLAAGMALAVLLLSGLLHVALVEQPMLVWGFFFGLICASILMLGRDVLPRDRLYVVAGVLLGLALIALPSLSGNEGLGVLLIGGMLAISAWMLPSISGSFVLVLLGLYDRVIAALATFNITEIAVFALGCLAGLMISARAVRWLLQRFSGRLMALLVGLMLGTLPRLWPWQVDTVLMSPAQYTQTVGPAQLTLTVVAIVAGCIAIFALGWLRQRSEYRATDGA